MPQDEVKLLAEWRKVKAWKFGELRAVVQDGKPQFMEPKPIIRF